MNRYFFIFSFILLSFLIPAQEGEKPLSCNINYLYKDLGPQQREDVGSQSLKTQTTSLQLPFMDDFYYATFNKYAKSNLWKDSSVYINSGFAIAPPSIGVATFDGLNKFGFPYDPNLINLNESLPADTLCSQPINLFQSGSQILQPSDSIGISFYYQPRGNGEPPELTDSLMLDFYKPIQDRWVNNVWFKKGIQNPNIIDTAFYRAFIWVKDTAYLHDGFKFRFRNKATTAGNFDQWHVDYVYLNKNRSMKGDTVYNDLTFGTVPSSYLLNYHAMPYEQYDNNEIGSKNSVRIKNNYSQTIAMFYENRFYDKGNNLVHSYLGGADNLDPFDPDGYSAYQPHATPVFGYTFPSMNDTCTYKIKHFVYRSATSTSDFLVENDTIYQFQDFKNYYAYDDGSAEFGYYINAMNAKMVIKIKVNYQDTLRAVRIYFDPTGSVSTVQQSSEFKINLWSEFGNFPNSLLYEDVLMLPKFSTNTFKASPEYKLTSKLLLNPGTYFIGIQQKVASGIVIGLDKNQDYHQNTYYDLGAGWTQTTIKGSLMIRPVFGKYVPPPVGLEESLIDMGNIKVYPNPSNDVIHVLLDTEKATGCSIVNAMGQVVLEEELISANNTISVATLPNGIYFLIIKEGTLHLQPKKIIVQH